MELAVASDFEVEVRGSWAMFRMLKQASLPKASTIVRCALEVWEKPFQNWHHGVLWRYAKTIECALEVLDPPRQQPPHRSGPALGPRNSLPWQKLV
jgi:hypothetical protein